MNFTEIFIRRPVFASVLSLLLMMVGLISYYKLTIRQFPEISASVINITTVYPGANAELMESFVTTPIESVLTGIHGIDYIESKSLGSVSTISAHFNLGYNMNVASSDVREKLSSIRSRLPKEIDDPVIEKQDPNSTPIQYIAFASDNLSSEQVTEYITRVVKPNLETINGVGEAKLFGDKRFAMRVWLNPQYMANHNITISEVITGLITNNPQSPAGRIKSETQEYEIQANTGLTTEQQFNNLILKQSPDYLTRVQDIGTAKLGAANDRFSVTMNDKQAIVVGIVVRTDANPLDVAKGVRETLAKLNTQMPGKMQAQIVWDASKFIDASIHEVKHTIIEATIFVILVILVFLGSFRILAIPVITIPLSLIGICFFMMILGFSLNTLTFLAMVLAIGLVVDDAIVVAENIHRHIEEGLSPFEASIKGASEIQFAIIAMTLTLAAVFAPIGFMSGLTGAFFKEFAFALAGTVLVSGFIALTLTPMMCSKLMSDTSHTGKLALTVDHFFGKLSLSYKKALAFVIRFRVVIPASMIFILAFCFFIFKFLPQELAPQEDAGAILTIVMGPATSNLQYTEKYTAEIAKILNTIPEKEGYGIINGFMGVNSAISFLMLKPWNERKRSVDEIIQSLFPQFFGITGVMAFPVNPFSLPGTEGLMPVSFVLQTNGDYKDLEKATNLMLMRLRTNPALVNVDSDLKIDKPEIQVNIDRDKAGILGVNVTDIGNTLNLALGEPKVSQFSMRGQSYDVIPQLLPSFLLTPDTLNFLHVRSTSGDLVPLSNLVTLDSRTQPRSLNHFQQLRSSTITAAYVPGYTLGQALEFLQQQAKEVLPPNINYDFSSVSRQFVTTSTAMGIVFGSAIIFIFLMLAAQFESFIDPFIVMISVPLSLAGALLVLMMHHYSLNIYTQIGLVTLVGLISKHGILIVEFANQLQRTGLSVKEAAIQAASIRLRPILMTTAAMLLGAVPLALASGAGAISRQQIGWTIIGGMSFGTLMTLFAVPAMYTYLSRNKQKIA